MDGKRAQSGNLWWIVICLPSWLFNNANKRQQSLLPLLHCGKCACASKFDSYMQLPPKLLSLWSLKGTYHISLIIASGDYFYFHTKRGRLFEGGDYFIIIISHRRSCPKFFVLLYKHECFTGNYIITKSMHALWLVNQLWFIVQVNPRKNRASVYIKAIDHKFLWFIGW